MEILKMNYNETSQFLDHEQNSADMQANVLPEVEKPAVRKTVLEKKQVALLKLGDAIGKAKKDLDAQIDKYNLLSSEILKLEFPTRFISK